MTSRNYSTLYTQHIAAISNDNQGVGGGEESVIASFQVELLRRAGILPAARLLELGCGTGRIWRHLGDSLDTSTASYIGLDVVEHLVDATRARMADLELPSERFAAFHVDGDSGFPTGYDADAVYAFSVFTHMEAEDIVRTLRELSTCCAPGARGLFTFLPLEHAFGVANFEQELSIAHAERFDRVRNIAFTRDMAERLMVLGGWRPYQTGWGELGRPFDEDGVVFTNQSWIAASLPG